jgi:glycosyltransferase involved in cell wall biosynthesis
MALKILITTVTYAPNADGCAEAATVLARGLAALGHSVIVATENHPGRQPDATNANPRVVSFNISGRDNWRVGIHGNTARYQEFLREFDGDLVIFENWDAWSTALARPLLGQIKAKKILVSHGYTPHKWNVSPKFPWGLGQWLGSWPLVARTPWLMRQMDHLVFLSRRRDWGRFFDHRLTRWLGVTHCSVIPNGAHADEFNDPALPDFRRDLGIGPGPMFLCVGKYCIGKNQLMALRAFRHAKIENSTFVMIGNEFNDYSEQILKLDKILGGGFPSGRVLLLEKQTRLQTCAAFKAADVFVLPSKAETQPIVLLEAMASHTAWLSTDCGCVPELPGGIIARSERDMTNQMRSLANSSDLRISLAQAGAVASREKYDWKQVVANYHELIVSLTPGKK